MKIAILSDIHGNLPALETVADHIERWRPDYVVVNGDIVNRGPKSVACWEFVQKRPFWGILRGNHEEYVLSHLDPNSKRTGLNQPSAWIFDQFSGNVQPFATLPTTLHINLPHRGCHSVLSDVIITHASLRGSRDGIYPQRATSELRQQISACADIANTAPAVFVTSHTHVPSVTNLSQTLLINSGSTGQPCDGDLRASYTQLAWQQSGWQGTIVRLPYDREQTKRDFWESGFLEDAGDPAPLIYHEWRTGQDVVVSWMKQYWTAVSAGEISWETAVAEHLQKFD
ncbi:MAG: metallophosphoesterase family protein [Chloroflexota bacterium]